MVTGYNSINYILSVISDVEFGVHVEKTPPVQSIASGWKVQGI